MLIDKYKEHINFLSNICSINNLPSIFHYGLFSKNKIIELNLEYTDLSDQIVQSIRDDKILKSNISLHSYVNLFINPRNSMMYRLVKNHDNDDLCIICVDLCVLNFKGTLVSDRNMACSLALYDVPELMINNLDFNLIFSTYWVDENHNQLHEIMSKMSAEVLVKDLINPENIKKIIVCSKRAKDKIRKINSKIDVEIIPKMFFREEVY